VTREQIIDALLPTQSKRPRPWYAKVNELIEQGFTFNHATAEWINRETGERGRISFTPEKAWLRHPEPTKKGVKCQT
jgi:hypothetical protein